MNAIERLREGIGAVDADRHLLGLQQKEAKRVQDAFDALAAVEALYQASKETGQLPFPPVSFDERNEWRSTLGALAAAVRRVEADA